MKTLRVLSVCLLVIFTGSVIFSTSCKKEEDDDNDKLFPNDYPFTLEDAAVSINLIMPLINDYIKHIEAKRSKK